MSDSIHLPDDAEGFEDGLRAIMLRIPPSWGRWISCSRGWYPILIGLDRDLAAIDPAYELHQCKEKFGGLRYYFSTELADVDNRMESLVREAEERCAATCDLCGEPGSMYVSEHGWYRTLCGTCAAAEERGYRPARKQ